ncbi:pentatricopeptide repeat-containing protein At3g29290-like [Tasmannia lanceolata]|uniref:pentatricopeptide repeat-containing protein At3g29290-like n=1 Tax=Tasmannia lanceolata TaxID=3420 RepID=UPI004063A8D1
MIQVLRSSSSISITPNGFPSPHHLRNHKNKKLVGALYCNLDFSSARRKTSRKTAVNNDLEKYGNWTGILPLQIKAVKCGFGSARKRGNFVKVVGFESGLVCEEEELNNSVQEKEEKLNMSADEQRLEHRIGPSCPILEGTLCAFDTKLHFLEERDEEVLSKRMLTLSRSNKVRSALELYMSIEASGLRPSIHACNSLLSCLLRNGSLNNALKVFDIMKEKETVTGHTYSLILKAVASAQGCDSALKMFVELEGERTLKRSFDAVVYNTMIAVCGKANNWVQMEGLWRKLKEDGYCGTMVTYRVLISTFVRCGQTELALDAFQEMVQNKLKPCEDVMKAIIGACAKEGKWALALDVFQLMLDGGLKPNAIAYNALINCLGKAGEVDLAFRIYNLMKSSRHVADVYTWNALLSALYRGNRYADVLQLFESIRREKSSDLNAHHYNVTLMSCQRLGLWDRSLQLLWHMEASGIPISTVSYNHVIGACEAARKPQVALQVYKHMIHQKRNPDTFTYLSLIRSCVWGSLWAEAEEILDYVTPDASLYNALIHGMCLRGRTTLAKKLYKRMRNSGLKPDGKTWALMLQHLPRDS